MGDSSKAPLLLSCWHNPVVVTASTGWCHCFPRLVRSSECRASVSGCREETACSLLYSPDRHRTGRLKGKTGQELIRARFCWVKARDGMI